MTDLETQGTYYAVVPPFPSLVRLPPQPALIATEIPLAGSEIIVPPFRDHSIAVCPDFSAHATH